MNSNWFESLNPREMKEVMEGSGGALLGQEST